MGNVISYDERKKKSLDNVKHYKARIKEVKLKQENIDEIIKKYLEG